MSDNNDLRKRLQGKVAQHQSTGELPGTSSTKYLPSSAEAAARLNEHAAPAKDAPVVLYEAIDGTGSMDFVIKSVLKCAYKVGSEIFQADKGIEACVLGINDHYDAAELQRSGRKLLGNYGQDNQPTSDARTLEQQVKNLVLTHGGDAPEAYECVAADLITKMEQSRAKSPNKKQVVVIFGDDEPHSNKECPYQRGPEQIVAMVALADHTYFVDCANILSGTSFKKGTYGPVSSSPKATYLKFRDAESVLPEAIIGMVKTHQSPTRLAEYFATLPAEKATKVAGLLGSR